MPIGTNVFGISVVLKKIGQSEKIIGSTAEVFGDISYICRFRLVDFLFPINYRTLIDADRVGEFLLTDFILSTQFLDPLADNHIIII